MNVARILSMMARTHNTLNGIASSNIENTSDDPTTTTDNNNEIKTWNSEILAQVITELAPSLSWKDVVRDFDNPEFHIKDKASLRLVITAIKTGLSIQHNEPPQTATTTTTTSTPIVQFPIEYIYSVWKNVEGQLSFIINSLKHPDIFSITDYPCRRTATECLKAQPEDDNRMTASWRSLNLIETLLNLSETGVYSGCIEIFKSPITHCPDLLLLGLLQLTTCWNKLKQEILAVIIPIFLGNHPNSAVILQYAWNQHYNTQPIRNLIMTAMTDWYVKAQDTEQNIRLARILDVSQDLKALSILLNGQPLLFNVDLACLAARRGYLKLDKWTSDRIRDHGELFITTVIAFLRRKCPQLISNLTKEEQVRLQAAQTMQIPLLPETLQSLLKCLQSSVHLVSNELAQEIYQMNARFLFDKQGNGSGNVITSSGIIINIKKKFLFGN
jgi:CCR4-NOT transcription complex subunit 1